MVWTFLLFAVVLTGTVLELEAYGFPAQNGNENRPAYPSFPRRNQPRRPFRPSRESSGFNKDSVWYPDSTFLNEPNRLHGPQIDFNTNDFSPSVGIPPFLAGGGLSNRPSRQGRRPQQDNGNTQNLFLPPIPNDSDDVFIFDRPTSSRPSPGPTRTTPSITTASTTTQAANCDCQSTPEFNPVCGSDGVTYSNPGRLKCAVFCGAAINMKHNGACITTSTAPPSSTTTLLT